MKYIENVNLINCLDFFTEKTTFQRRFRGAILQYSVVPNTVIQSIIMFAKKSNSKLKSSSSDNTFIARFEYKQHLYLNHACVCVIKISNKIGTDIQRYGNDILFARYSLFGRGKNLQQEDCTQSYDDNEGQQKSLRAR